MTPEQKVATLMVVLGEERAGELLASLSREEARKVLSAIARLGTVDEAMVEKVITETLQLLRAPVAGGVNHETARKIVDAASTLLGDPSFRSALEGGILAQEITENLENLKGNVVAGWLRAESPAVAATVLSLATPPKAAEIFRSLPDALQPHICLAIAALQSVDESALEALHQEICRLRQGQSAQVAPGGVATVTRLLQNLDSELRQSILEKLDEKSPPLSQEIRRQLLSLEKIAQLLPRDLGRVFSKMSDKELALLLKVEPQPLRDTFLAAISQNRAETVRDTLDSLGPVRKTEVETVRQKIQALVEKLHAEGSLILPWEDKMV